MTENYIDGYGSRIQEGDHVRFMGDVDGPVGRVTGFADPDADFDGERFIPIGPFVYVLWETETEPEKFFLSCTARGPWDNDSEFESDELELVR